VIILIIQKNKNNAQNLFTLELVYNIDLINILIYNFNSNKK
jgi:hypothetical protein